MELTDFMQRLALVLTSHEATTFLLGEYGEGEHDSAVFTVADGLLWLYQATDRNSVVRKLQVMKMRGQGQIPGLHTARITDEGLQRLSPHSQAGGDRHRGRPLEHRLGTGVPGLDKMMDGGIPQGYSVLVAGPSGSGKTVLSNQFIVEGDRARRERDRGRVREATQRLPTDHPAGRGVRRSWSARRSWRFSTCARSTSRSTRP